MAHAIDTGGHPLGDALLPRTGRTTPGSSTSSATIPNLPASTPAREGLPFGVLPMELGGGFWPPSPQEIAQPQALAVKQLTVAALDSIIQLLYGGAPIVGQLANVYDYGSYYLFWVIWCGGPIDSFIEVLMDDAALPVGTSHTDYTGTLTQTADAQLVATIGGGFAETLPGLCYSVIQVLKTAVTAQPKMIGVIQGRRLYDPRQDSTNGGSGAHRLADQTTWTFGTHSNTPALIAADFFGQLCGKTLDWPSVIATANLNDATEQGEESRRMFLQMDREQSVDAWSATMATAMNARIVPNGNVYKFVPDVAGSSVASYTHSNGQILSITNEQIADASALPTVMEIIYTNPNVYPWAEGTVNVQRAGVSGGTVPYRKSTLRMPWVYRKTQALREAYQRINKLWHRRLTFTVELFDEGLLHEPGDIITIDYPDSGYSNLVVKVNSVKPTTDGWALDVAVEAASAYTYDSVVA